MKHMVISVRVAIIDDVQMNVVILQHLVKKLSGCEPVCFTDPVAALEWCVSNVPDLVVVDYMMPQLNGTDLVK